MNDPQQWQQHRAFGALDWASQTHCVVVVDQTGKVIEDFQIEYSALGWKKFREKLQSYGAIPFAIETSQGAAVEQLLEAGMMVYPLNPKSAQAFGMLNLNVDGHRTFCTGTDPQNAPSKEDVALYPREWVAPIFSKMLPKRLRPSSISCELVAPYPRISPCRPFGFLYKELSGRTPTSDRLAKRVNA